MIPALLIVVILLLIGPHVLTRFFAPHTPVELLLLTLTLIGLVLLEFHVIN